MLNRVRDTLGLAGLIVACVALIAALGGSAIAANGGGAGDATASAKKGKNRKGGGGNVNKLIKREARKFSKVFSQRFAKRFPGPIGPQGFPGLPGAPGEDGDDGDDGSDGSNGTNGKSAEVSEVACGGLGGAEVKVEGAAEGVEVCNGEKGDEGKPWTELGKLPIGETETGTLSGPVIGTSGEGVSPIPVSISIPPENAPEPVFLSPSEESAPGCPGLVGGVPQAEEGKLCVYMQVTFTTSFEGFFDPTAEFAPGASSNGTVLFFTVPKETSLYVYGSWAVTAGA